MTDKILEIEKQEITDILDKLGAGKKMPKIKSGDIVRVVQVYQEKDKERHSVFEGMVIAINSGSNTRRTITVRRVIDGVGVEKIIPLYLSNISQIKVLKSSKVRRAKLYYLRNLSGKKARLKDKGLDKEVIELMALEEEKKVQKEQEEKKDKKLDKVAEVDKTKKSDEVSSSDAAKAKTNDQGKKKTGK